MENNKKEESNFLFKIWNMAEEKLEGIKMKKASKRLQRQAEIEVGKSLDKVDEADSLFEAAVAESLKTGNFEKISTASLNLQTTKKVHESALNTYKLVFGEDPKLV